VDQSLSREKTGSASSERNIETIIKLEKEDQSEFAPHHRAFHAIGWFVGTIYFIVAQCVIIAGWIVFNAAQASHAWAIDPFPFPLLSTFLSLEAVLLTSCVLIRQNAMNQTSERRDHLELQINLLAEKEATRSLEILQRIAEHLKIPLAKDRQSDELAKDTSVDEIARDLRAREKENS
jgi:uncharacterized membrane protein